MRLNLYVQERNCPVTFHLVCKINFAMYADLLFIAFHDTKHVINMPFPQFNGCKCGRNSQLFKVFHPDVGYYRSHRAGCPWLDHHSAGNTDLGKWKKLVDKQCSSNLTFSTGISSLVILLLQFPCSQPRVHSFVKRDSTSKLTITSFVWSLMDCRMSMKWRESFAYDVECPTKDCTCSTPGTCFARWYVGESIWLTMGYSGTFCCVPW